MSGAESDSLAAFTLTKKLLSTLVSSAAPEDFCRSLVHNILNEQNAIAAFICRAEGDGSLQMMGSYGYPPERGARGSKVSIFDPMGITDSIRENRVLVFNGWEDYKRLYPNQLDRASPGKAFVAVPFSREGFPAGGVGIAFGDYVTESQFNKLLWETIQLIGEVYVSPTWFSAAENREQLEGVSARHPKIKPEDLPERARKVLELMAQGKTNWQIASILRFSESTIKLDASLIFRSLDVNTRESAVVEAKKIGLIA